jgi:hypothetical protein
MSEIETKVEQPEPNPSIPRYVWRRGYGWRRRPPNNRVRRSPRIWYTEEEFEQVDYAAMLCEKPTNTFIRAASLGVRLTAQPFNANAELIRELGKNGMALSRLAAIARETRALSVAERLDAALQELLALLGQIAPNGGGKRAR